MAAASQKPFAGHIKKKVHGALCTVIFMVLLDRSVLLMAASIHAIPGYTRLTARIGEDVKIPFEFCLNGRMPSCIQALTFNLSAPNPLCTANHRHGHCQINAAPEDHPGRPGLYNQHECELCELTVQQVQQEDIGQYSICQLPGCLWQSLTLLEIENDTTPKSSASEPISTTTLGPADLSSSVSTTNNTTTEDRPEIRIDSGTTAKPINIARIGMKTSSAIGVSILALVILIICVALYLYKRQSRRQPEHIYYQATESPSTNGTTATVNIKVNNADACSIEIDSETAHFTEDPDVNTS